MSKNFFSPKTGHHASDEYFKNQALWHDSDLLKYFLLGAFIGAVITFFAFVMLPSLLHMLLILLIHGSLLLLVGKVIAPMF
jgi:hypothetical protein